MGLTAVAAAAAAGVSDLAFVEGKGQSDQSTKVFKYLKRDRFNCLIDRGETGVCGRT